jgi:glyoxylase-like metal-dependent hydrolase (beta-lactamase superfamily II)
LLKSGSILKDEFGKILDARSSITLVISGSKRIIVDTGLIGDAALIIDALALNELTPYDIDIVINTHSHPDHNGNNDLFNNSEFLTLKEAEAIAPNVSIMETAGHTADSISVRIDAEDIVIVAGDALPTFNNYLKNMPPSIHVDRDQAISSMNRIINNARIVVPGHDYPFSVVDKKYVLHLNRDGFLRLM